MAEIADIASVLLIVFNELFIRGGSWHIDMLQLRREKVYEEEVGSKKVSHLFIL